MGDPYPGKVRFKGGKPIRLTWEETVAVVALGGWPEKHWAKAAAVVDAESGRAVNIYNTYLEGHWGLFQVSKKYHPKLFTSGTDEWMNPVLNSEEGYRIYRSQGWKAWEAYTNGRYTGSLLQATAVVETVKAKRRKWKGSEKDFYLSLMREGIVTLVAFAGKENIGQNLTEGIAAGAEKTGDLVAEAGAAAAAAAQEQAGAVTALAHLTLGAAEWMSSPANWVRVAQVVTGGVLLVVGVGIAVRPVATSAAVKQATRVAKGIAQ